MSVIFPYDVERWRASVYATINDILEVSSTYQNRLASLNLSREQIEQVILGIIQKESSGNPDAIGDNGCSIGLMQLNFCAGTPQGAGYQGTKDGLLDPATNIYYGTLYFFSQLNRYNDLAKAISAYNAGHATESNLETYVNKIFGFIGEKKISLSEFQS
jgi:soluble lytic murein transglycosylase-like protein